jgi:alcohol dehydrogenase class IV
VPAESAAVIAEKAVLDTAAGTNPRSASTEELEQLIVEVITVGR